jgi:hypothetical protein
MMQRIHEKENSARSRRYREDKLELALGYRGMKKLLAIAAVGEAGIGLVLLVYPPVVVRLLFAAEIAGAGVVMSRIAGISLIALGMACWPGRRAKWATLRHADL